MPKKLRNIIKFEEGKPVNVTFDYNVGSARPFEQKSDYTDSGKVTKYSVAVNKNEIIFATESLFNKIKHYQQNDSAVITFSEKRWVVNDSGETKSSPSFEEKLTNGALLTALRQISEDIKIIKEHIYGEEKRKKYPSDSDISF